MKSLKRKEDVKASKEAATSESGRHFLRIPDTKTPWRLLSLEYEDGYIHWVEIQGRKLNVPCVGGVEGKGFDPDNCPICAETLRLYEDAKALKAEGKTKESKIAKESANDMRAKYQALFIAVRGQKILIKERGKDGKIRKAWAADFDMSSEDSDVEVGVLALSKSQFSNLIGLIGSEETPFIKTGSDLGNRVLWSKKNSKKGKGSDYTEVTWTADAKSSEPPEVEVPDNVSIEGYFDVDEKTLGKVVSYLTGEEATDIPEDDAVEAEEDEVLENDESTEEATEEDFGDEPDDGFEDDIPWDDEDEEPEEKPKKVVKHSTKRSRKAKI